ncbi:MAG: hypothetical protein JWP61_567 [Friedmanniella sp.]|nr:hypothetical protein [Friedmanniella sp.]
MPSLSQHSSVQRRLAALLVLGALVASPLLTTGTADAATKAPRTPTGLPRAIEGAAPLVPANSCDPRDRAGTVKLAALLRSTYPGTATTTLKACNTETASSEHFDGRALDWKVSVHSAGQSAQATAVTRWLLGTDAAGHADANARRLGVMTVVWNGRQWVAGQAGRGWQPFLDCAGHPEKASDGRCHRTSLHVSLSWAGANAKTSFWSKKVAANDYGPCAPQDLNWASRYTTANPRPCPAHPRLNAPAGADRNVAALTRVSGLRLPLGTTGTTLTALQRMLEVPASGTFDAVTRARLTRYQSVHDLNVTGTMNNATWRSLLASTAAKKPPTTGTTTSTMPTTSPAGWRRLYSEDFGTVTGLGSFVNSNPNDWYLNTSNAYHRSLRSYPDGWGTTGNVSYNWASRTTSVTDTASSAPGVFKLWAHTESIGGTNKALAGAFFPVIRPDAATNLAQTAQTFGRYSVRFRTTGGYPTSGGGARYGSAFLLWPASDTWAEGEVDFPEMAWGGKINGFVHQMGQPWNNAHVISSDTSTEGAWHTATIEWYPNALIFSIDGTRISKITDNVPQTPFRWGFQSGGHDGTPASTVDGSLLVDWITIDAYDGATAPR